MQKVVTIVSPRTLFRVARQNLQAEAVRTETEAREQAAASEGFRGFEDIFRAQYGRVARLIGRVIRDPARAEELAVEVFLKFWRARARSQERPEAWLHRVAVRKAIDELRRETRRTRYEGLFRFGRRPPTPEELRNTGEEQERVRAVLAAIDRRDAALLLLRGDGLTYEETASTLSMNPASVGTLLARAQQAFRKEYVSRYGKQ